MKQSELVQIKSFIAYIHTKYPPDGNVVHEALVEVENYVAILADKTTKVDGRASAWTDERREKMGTSVTAKAIERRNAKSQSKIDSQMVWLWDYAGEPPKHISTKEAAEFIGKSEQYLTKYLAQSGDFVAAVPKQLRSVCFTLENNQQALYGMLQQADKELAPAPKAKR